MIIEMAVKAIKDGAVDFVQKPHREQQLLDAIDEALRRDAARRNEPVVPLPGNEPDGVARRLDTLTAREREVMALALKGVPNKLLQRASR